MTWQPIESCTAAADEKVDLWAVDRKTGRGWRVPDARRSRRDGLWLDARGGVFTGKRYRDAEGDECYDWFATDKDSVIVTHWMPPPAGPCSVKGGA